MALLPRCVTASLSLLAMVMAAAPVACGADSVLVSEDFASVMPAVFKKTSTVGSDNGNILFTINPPQEIRVAATDAGKNALEFVDNDAEHPTLVLARWSFPEAAAAAPIIQGTFDFTPLNATGSATGSDNPDMVFAIQNGQSIFTNAQDTGVDIIFANGNKVTYFDADGQSDTLAFLEYGMTYRFSVRANFGRENQGTYAFTITNTADNSVVYSSPAINTRAPKVSAGSLLFTGGNNVPAASASPFWRIENVSFKAVTPNK